MARPCMQCGAFLIVRNKRDESRKHFCSVPCRATYNATHHISGQKPRLNCKRCLGPRTERYGKSVNCKACDRIANTARTVQKWGSLGAYAQYRKFGLRPEDVERMRQAQGGKCAICGTNPAKNIDHCHRTNRIRGLLCDPCNLAIGALGDTVEGLLRAVAYLRESEMLRAV